MERDMNQSALPAFCRSGCGFYGSPATDGLCSKCFKDSLKRKQDPGRLSPASSSSSVPKSDPSMSSHESLTSPTTSNSCLTGAPIMMNSIEAVDVPGMIQNALNEKIAAAALIEEAKKCAEDATNASADDSSSSSSSSTSEKKDEASSNEGNSPQPPPEKKSNRCDECRKKVGFTGFECRCGGLYCAIHRYTDMHFCPFDYKALGAEEIRKNNPVVKNEKIQKL